VRSRRASTAYRKNLLDVMPGCFAVFWGFAEVKLLQLTRARLGQRMRGVRMTDFHATEARRLALGNGRKVNARRVFFIARILARPQCGLVPAASERARSPLLFDIVKKIRAARFRQAKAVLVGADPFFNTRREQIVGLATPQSACGRHSTQPRRQSCAAL